MSALQKMPFLTLCLCASLVCPLEASTRIGLSLRDAWRDASVQILRGRVDDVSYSHNTAYYRFRVAEVLKSVDGTAPSVIVVADPYWNTFAAITLNLRSEFVLYTRKSGEHFQSLREIEIDSLEGQQHLRAIRLFLNVMSVTGLQKQQTLCLTLWDARLSDLEKGALLDAMWETPSPTYSDVLLAIAKGNDSPDVRSWAVTVLSHIQNGNGVEQLIPILLNESDYSLRRQLLILFGTYRVQGAVAAIDELLRTVPQESLPAWQQSQLCAVAKEAQEKITGENASPYWRN